MTRETVGTNELPPQSGADSGSETAAHVERRRRAVHVDYAEMRAEADAVFGERRLGDDDPWERAGSSA
jgi:hypothetical protein